jgi:PIN domain nuclease of toxin-antitoxin system
MELLGEVQGEGQETQSRGSFAAMILLDTHAAVWLAVRPERLSSASAAAIRRTGEGLAMASVSLMEMSQLMARGDLVARGTPQAWLREFVARTGVALRDITVEIAAVAGHLPPAFPSDPFDRLIAATAIVGRIPLITADTRIQASGVVRTIW